jgi:iron(III) transport system ATP-binding protein
VATFVGRTNLMEARILGKGRGDALRLDTPAGVVEAICPTTIREQDEASLSIRPENVRLHAERPPDNTPNVFPGRVEYVLFLGESAEYHVTVGRQLLISRQHHDVELKRGQEIFVEFPTHHCIVVSDEHGTTPDSRSHEDDEDEGTEFLQPASVFAAEPV